MSIRSLIEINHDYCHFIEKDPAQFVERLRYYLGNGARSSADELERYGVVVFGSRHHSQPFGSETIAAMHRRESHDRSPTRDADAAAIAYVRDCLKIMGQEMTDDEVFDVARKVQRSIKRMTVRTNRSPHEKGAQDA